MLMPCLSSSLAAWSSTQTISTLLVFLCPWFFSNQGEMLFFKTLIYRIREMFYLILYFETLDKIIKGKKIH